MDTCFPFMIRMKRVYLFAGIFVVVILILAVVFVLFQNQNCENCAVSSEFCTENSLEDCDGKKVSIIGVINSIPVGKYYGYDMADGVEWDGKLISNVIVNIDTTKLTVPLGKKIQVNGTVRAMQYIDEADGLQHLVDSEGRSFDPTYIIAEEIRELSENEIDFDYIFGEELQDKIGERVILNGTFWSGKGTDLIAMDGDFSNSTRLFFENETLHEKFGSMDNGTVSGIIEKRIFSYGKCLEIEVRQVCGDHLVYGINVESIENNLS